MPNHYSVIAICIPGVETEFDVDDWNEQHANTNLCAVAIPIPEELEDIHVGHNSTLNASRWRGDGDNQVAIDKAEQARLIGRHGDL